MCRGRYRNEVLVRAGLGLNPTGSCLRVVEGAALRGVLHGDRVVRRAIRSVCGALLARCLIEACGSESVAFVEVLDCQRLVR